MSKLKQIYEGWKNYVFLNEEVEKAARVKADICSKCPNAVEDKWFDLVDERIEELSGLKCKLCDCPLSTLTRSKDKKCKIKRW